MIKNDYWLHLYIFSSLLGTFSPPSYVHLNIHKYSYIDRNLFACSFLDDEESINVQKEVFFNVKVYFYQMFLIRG